MKLNNAFFKSTLPKFRIFSSFLLIVYVSFNLGFLVVQADAFKDNPKNEITVVTEEWAPYNYKENGKITGMGTEIVRATLKKANIEAKIEMYPWSRAYQMAEMSKNHLIFTMARTEEREKKFKWIGPFAQRKMYLFKKKEREDFTIIKLEDIKLYQTGLVRSDAMVEFFESNGFISGTHFQVVPTEDDNIKKLFAKVKRIDFITGSELSLAFKMKQLGYNYSDVKKEFLLIDKGGYYMAFNNKTSDELVNRVRKAFEEIKSDGTMNKIKEKYLK